MIILISFNSLLQRSCDKYKPQRRQGIKYKVSFEYILNRPQQLLRSGRLFFVNDTPSKSDTWLLKKIIRSSTPLSSASCAAEQGSVQPVSPHGPGRAANVKTAGDCKNFPILDVAVSQINTHSLLLSRGSSSQNVLLYLPC